MAAPTLPGLEHAGRRPQLHVVLCHQATDSPVSLSCSFSPFMSGFLAPPASPPPPRHSHLHSRVHTPHPHTHTPTHARARTHTHTQCTLASRHKAKLCSAPVHQEPSRTVDQAPSAWEGASAFTVWAKTAWSAKAGSMGEQITYGRAAASADIAFNIAVET